MSQRSPLNPRNTKDEVAGVAKKSAARAKPARGASESVRVVSSGSTKSHKGSSDAGTKEEKRERKEAQRQEEDRINVVTNLMLKQDEEYTRRRRVWWALIAIGLVMTIASAFMMLAFPTASNDSTTPIGIISIVILVLAYVVIIGAFGWDYFKVRKLHDAAEQKSKSMSPKKRQAIIDADFAAQAEAKAAKEAAKQGKKKGKDE